MRPLLFTSRLRGGFDLVNHNHLPPVALWPLQLLLACVQLSILIDANVSKVDMEEIPESGHYVYPLGRSVQGLSNRNIAGYTQ